MSSLYKLLWAVADSRVFRSTVIYQVTEGVTWKEGTKACFDKGCAFQEPTSGVTEKASGHQALKRVEQWGQNRTGSQEKDELPGREGEQERYPRGCQEGGETKNEQAL